jgi:hypothetical protein
MFRLEHWLCQKQIPAFNNSDGFEDLKLRPAEAAASFNVPTGTLQRMCGKENAYSKPTRSDQNVPAGT